MAILLYPDDPGAIEKVAQLLRSGAIGAIPTETVYGLTADALRPTSVARIFEAKGRPLQDPLIVHVHDLQQAQTLAHIPPDLVGLLGRIWPGPATLVFPKKEVVPALVTASGDTVALRIPAHPVFRDVLRHSGLALAAPSANPFGRISPTEAGHVEAHLGDKIDFILDGGPCSLGIESTVLDASQPGRLQILRPGPLTREVLEDEVRLLRLSRRIEEFGGQEPGCSPVPQVPLKSPGLLERHYSPRTPLFLFPPGSIPAKPHPMHAARKIGVLHFSRPEKMLQAYPRATQYWLTTSNDQVEAARNLFRVLHQMDAMGFDVLYVEEALPTGEGKAINDRLSRASTLSRR